MDEEMLKKLDIKPSIQEQMQVTTDWWKSINPNQDVYLPLQTVKKLFVAKRLT